MAAAAAGGAGDAAGERGPATGPCSTAEANASGRQGNRPGREKAIHEPLRSGGGGGVREQAVCRSQLNSNDSATTTGTGGSELLCRFESHHKGRPPISVEMALVCNCHCGVSSPVCA